jgi:hypothetical protein
MRIAIGWGRRKEANERGGEQRTPSRKRDALSSSENAETEGLEGSARSGQVVWTATCTSTSTSLAWWRVDRVFSSEEGRGRGGEESEEGPPQHGGGVEWTRGNQIYWPVASS